MDLDSFKHDRYWCLQSNKIECCPGPCPDGTLHVALPPCRTCDGIGRIGAWLKEVSLSEFAQKHLKGVSHGYQLCGTICPDCNGQGAVVPAYTT